MRKKEIKIVNKLGLHLRAASELSKLASKFTCEVLISNNTKKGINAKSVLGVTMLAAGFGSQVTISTEGQDEELAINEINDLFINKFGEKE